MPQPKLYLIPGQGSDGRLFQNLTLAYESEVIEFLTPEKGESLPAYAKRMSHQIDTSELFVLVGVSLGGMIAVEIAKQTDPMATVLIASAKERKELPPGYRTMKHIPLHKLFSGNFYIKMTRWGQPFYEPMDDDSQELWRSMIDKKDPVFMKRAIHAIVNWENDEIPENVFQIHGTKDRTLPLKHVNPDYIIEEATHVMTLTHGPEISALINSFVATRLNADVGTQKNM